MKLTRKERILRQIRGQEVDQIPSLGGWIGGAYQLAAIAGISIDRYLKDPYRGMILAHQVLNVDGMIQPVYHTDIHQMRTGHVQESSFSGIEPEAICDYANQLPDSEKEILTGFNEPEEEQKYRLYFQKAFKEWEGIIPIPNFWEIGGHFPLYTQFGYTAFWLACAEYPEAVGKIWWVRSLHSRQRAKILVKLYNEFDLIPLMFCGEDLCNNSGPMVHPQFLRKYYLPTVQLIIEPLVESGIRLIHHCDGDVRPLINDYLAIGFSGLQGFQYELGIDLFDLGKLRSHDGQPLLLFTGLSVSRTLPLGTLEDIRAEIDYFFSATNGGQGMFLFTSNVTGVEVPYENIIEAYRYIKTKKPGQFANAFVRSWKDVLC
jgi:hypothetical protein